MPPSLPAAAGSRSVRARRLLASGVDDLLKAWPPGGFLVRSVAQWRRASGVDKGEDVRLDRLKIIGANRPAIAGHFFAPLSRHSSRFPQPCLAAGGKRPDGADK